MTPPLWARLPLASKAFLGVGLASLLCLLWPGDHRPLQVIVQVGVVCAGLLGFQEVWSRRGRAGRVGSALSPLELGIVRLLEWVSIVLGLVVVIGRL